MARGDADRRTTWSAYLKSQLERLRINPAELSRRTGIPNKTIYNWTRGDGTVSSETCLILAAAFGAEASEVLAAAGYQMLADAMAGKKLRLADAPPEPIDPIIKWILENDAFPPNIKPMIIEYHRKRMQIAAERAEYDTRVFGEALAEKREAG